MWLHPKNPDAIHYTEARILPDYLGTYEPALRGTIRRRFSPLDWHSTQRLAAVSFYYWVGRTSSGGAKPCTPDALADMVAATRSGTGACRQQWRCCDYCHHGNAMIVVSYYLAAARAACPVRGNVTITCPGVDDPAEVLRRCRTLLSRTPLDRART